MIAAVPLEELRATAVLAVIRAPSADAALAAAEALLAGGIHGIEITYSTPDVPHVLATLAERHGDSILLGAGTLLRPQDAAEAVAAGARFLVSPGIDEPVVAAMRATGATVMVGALTPSEVMEAQRLGADVVKLFPASLGGPGYLRALRGPFPDLPLMPTGGVSADNLGEWFSAGAVAVGAGGELCSSADMADACFDRVTESARRFRAALDAQR